VLLLLGRFGVGVRPWFSGNLSFKFGKRRLPEKFQDTHHCCREWENSKN